MRADIHDGPEHNTLQSEADTLMQDRICQVDETSCNARPDHTFGSEAAVEAIFFSSASGLPASADITGAEALFGFGHKLGLEIEAGRHALRRSARSWQIDYARWPMAAFSTS